MATSVRKKGLSDHRRTFRAWIYVICFGQKKRCSETLENNSGLVQAKCPQFSDEVATVLAAIDSFPEVPGKRLWHCPSLIMLETAKRRFA